ncbi:MAG: hypothetical protein RBT51_04575 [Ectothiorhodospiraceae bacterium]|jgi:hypothetical protein|nr:hypothetical protein [Ectothiorhodospiraceae bacterium]
MKFTLPGALAAAIVTIGLAFGPVQAQDQGITDMSPQQREAFLKEVEARKQAEKARKADKKQAKEAKREDKRERVQQKIDEAEQRLGETR